MLKNELKFHRRFLLRIFGCNTAQLGVALRKCWIAGTLSVCDDAQHRKNVRKNSFLNYKSGALRFFSSGGSFRIRRFVMALGLESAMSPRSKRCLGLGHE